MKVLVTGAAGFVAGRVAHALARAGHTVTGLVRDPEKWTGRPDGAVAVRGDVTDGAGFRAAASGQDAVVHAAAMVQMWRKDRSEFDRINVGGLRNAVDAARGAGAKLVYTSSFIALGPTDGTALNEDSPRMPGEAHNDYERTKWAADRVAREAAAAGEAIVRLYPGVVYGPGTLTPGNHLVVTLLQHARGKLPGRLGPGDRRMSFAFVDDVTSGFVAAVERAAPGSAYVLGGDNRTLTDLFAVFERETGIAPPRLTIPYWAGSLIGKMQRWRADLFGVEPELTDEVVEIYKHEWAYDSSRAVRELGYRVTPLEEGMAKTCAWLREAGHLTPRGTR